MARIAGVLFDKDGTLFDFQATWGAWSRGLIESEAGGDPASMARMAGVLGYDLGTGRFRPDSLVIASTTEEVAGALLPLVGGDRAALVARMNARAAAAPQAEVPGLREALDRLGAMGLALGVATNDAEGPALAHLEGAGVRDAFAFVAGFDSGHGAKPGPGPLLAFAEAVGLEPGAVVMVGDSLHDLRAARAAGMRAVAVLTGVAGRAELEPLAEAVLGSVAELPDWVAARG
ncbi:HAD family hydrolase [Rubellimicrobium aerolatum]|uniref:phosphoglycolate phosphatase n=1 Tax=Rubellimicrobium aerolatum TaxID=490979 RepID=A0ABW0SE86_9RHOB|nr:HAD-IA family hydrolase [Rubellimicrobium aerolatum]MBP1805674.1 phosphoglycolate phosphatase [Rubellimicrobium aerolatum]